MCNPDAIILAQTCAKKGIQQFTERNIVKLDDVKQLQHVLIAHLNLCRTLHFNCYVPVIFCGLKSKPDTLYLTFSRVVW